MKNLVRCTRLPRAKKYLLSSVEEEEHSSEKSRETHLLLGELPSGSRQPWTMRDEHGVRGSGM